MKQMQILTIEDAFAKRPELKEVLATTIKKLKQEADHRIRIEERVERITAKDLSIVINARADSGTLSR